MKNKNKFNIKFTFSLFKMSDIYATKYASEFVNLLNTHKNVAIKSVFYDIGYSRNSVTLPTFNRVLEQFKNIAVKNVYTVEIGGKYSKNSIKNFYERKEKLTINTEQKDYPYTVSAQKIDHLNNINFSFSPNVRTEVIEYRYNHQNSINVIFSIIDSYVLQNNLSNLSELTQIQEPVKKYEIKLILIGKTVKDIQNFFIFNRSLLSNIMNTDIFYILKERSDLVEFFKNIYYSDSKPPFIKSDEYKYTLDSNILNRARNLKLRDMTYGGLVGNSQTKYGITPKADGIRKLILVHHTGIWLVTPPYDFNLVIRLNGFDRYIGSSFDAEFIPDNKRIKNQNLNTSNLTTLFEIAAHKGNTAPDCKYWCLLFDTLSSTNPDDNSISSIQIQNATKSVRLAYCGTFANEYTKFLETSEKNSSLRPKLFVQKNTKKLIQENTIPAEIIPVLIFTKKERYLFNTVQQFFMETSKLFLNTDKANTQLAYLTDGFMIEPENTPYNTYSYKKPLNKRILTEIPDICKVKSIDELTIDFLLKSVNNVYILYSGKSKYDNSGEKYIQFVGTKINKFDNHTMLDTTNLNNIPDNSIVEMWFDLNTNLMKFKQIRTNKDKPNNIDTAIQIWDDIHRPIDKDTLFGESDQLVRYYHNKIKRKIFAEAKPEGKTLLDLGAGRGGSVNEYAKFDKVLAIEPNPESIIELTKRVQSLGLQNKVKILQGFGQDTAFVTNETINWLGGPANTISMMNTLTFFWKDENTLDALVQTINNNLKPGGQLLFITIDGDVISEFFRPKLLQQNQMIKNRPESRSNEILELGQLITIKYFDTERPYINIDILNSQVKNQDEWLVHLADLELKFEKYGISLNYKNRAIEEKFLSKNELIFTNMYYYGTFTKKKISSSKKMNFSNQISDIDATLLAEEQEEQQELKEPLDFSKIRSPRANLSTSPRDFSRGAKFEILPISNPLLPIPLGLSEEDLIIKSDFDNSKNSVSNFVNARITNTHKTLVTKPLQLPLNKIAGIPIFESEKNSVVRYTDLAVPSTQKILVSPNHIETAEDDAVLTVQNDIVWVNTISNHNSFYHALLKSFYPLYANKSGYEYRENIVNNLRSDLSKLVTVDDNYQNLLEDLDQKDLSINDVQNLFLNPEEFDLGLVRFISKAIGIDIIIYTGFTPIYDAQNTDADYVVLLYMSEINDFKIIGKLKSVGVQTVFSQEDPFLEEVNELNIE